MANSPNSTLPHASVTSMLGSLVSLVYPMRKFPGIKQYNFASGTFLQQICISLVLETVT